MTSEAPPSCVTRGPVTGPPSPTMSMAHGLHSACQPVHAGRPYTREVTPSRWEQVVLSPAAGSRPGTGKALRGHKAARTHRVTLCLENRGPRLGPARLALGPPTTLSCRQGTQLLGRGILLDNLSPPPSPRAGHPGMCLSPPGPHWAGCTRGCVLLTSDTQDLLKSQPRLGHPASGIDQGHTS